MGDISEMVLNFPVLMSLGPKLVLIGAIGVLLSRLTGRLFPLGIYILAIIAQTVLSIYTLSVIRSGAIGTSDPLTAAYWGLALDWLAPVTLLIIALTVGNKAESNSSVEWNT
jgi:hypothetical protein